MGATDQYQSDMAYLKRLAGQGTLNSNNSILQRLEGKRNVKELDDWFKLHIDGHVNAV